MRILYVSNFDTQACRTGAEWRSFWFRRALERIGEVRTVELTANEKLSRKLTVWNVWTAVLRKLCPLMTFPYYCDDFAMRFVEGQKFDAIVVRYSAVAAYIGAWSFRIPCYIDIDDLPEQLCKAGWKRILLRFWQRWLYRKVTGCWVANREHVKIVERYTRCIALPNIANGPKRVVEVPHGSQILLSVGSLGHSPNVEGIDRFVTNDWPKIHKEFPAVEYWIVGGCCPQDVAVRWGRVQGVKLLGFVDDLAPVYATASAVICPIYSGSGTCIKTVEAIMHGRVVIGSPFAFRGWTDEQLSQPFVKIGGTNLATVCCEHLHERARMGDVVSPQKIRAWADAQFGDKSVDDAVAELIGYYGNG